MAKINDGGIRYGSVSALISTVDSESSMTMKTFLEFVEQKYPYAEGWRVVQRETTPLEQNVAGAKSFLPYRTYHLEKIDA